METRLEFFLGPEGGCETFTVGSGLPVLSWSSASYLFSCICGCSVYSAISLSLFVQYQEDASDIKDMSNTNPTFCCPGREYTD